MNTEIKLCDLPIKQNAVVTQIDCMQRLKERMSDLGIYEGAVISPILKSPFNDPKAYRVCDTTIALRNSDAEKITVQCGD